MTAKEVDEVVATVLAAIDTAAESVPENLLTGGKGTRNMIMGVVKGQVEVALGAFRIQTVASDFTAQIKP